MKSNILFLHFSNNKYIFIKTTKKKQMKSTIFTIVFLAAIQFSIFSQDIITKKSGEDIEAKVLEVTQTEIKYKKTNNIDGPTFTLAKTDILMIRYENGSKDIFNQQENDVEKTNKTTTTNNNTNENMTIRGMQDAKLNYKGKNSGAGWTSATTVLFSPILGAIPAFACAFTPPSDDNLNYKDINLMKNPEYNKAYVDEAKKKKRKKVLAAYSISSAAWFLLFLLI